VGPEALTARGEVEAGAGVQDQGANASVLSVALRSRTSPVRPAALCPVRSAARPWSEPRRTLSKHITDSHLRNWKQQ